MGLGMGVLLAANYLFVFMTVVSTAPFEELGIMRTAASHNMCPLLQKAGELIIYRPLNSSV